MASRPQPGPFVVIAEFVVKPGRMAEFLDAALDDARASLRDEPGCRQFDVIRPETQPGGFGDTVVFYEVYDNREAFDTHLQTAHLARFREAFPPLVETERPVRFAERVHP
ncbi:putative quinol monooxygenase [Arenibaculum pallidiluteum]|uniref:putative quinol monooxygenase n=1 Tax=Arenibaculum pallidiluteum TaxID=2812559 RepID=UPI001A975D16|nr:putative quinol monooxygenase [Arenibaculum pallidiluteum]